MAIISITSGRKAGTRRTEQTEEKLKQKKRKSEKKVLNFTAGQIKETKMKRKYPPRPLCDDK